MTLPLTKTLEQSDLLDLAPELVDVDEAFTSASPQHPMRRWEYALALRAFGQWGYEPPVDRPLALYDVGGAGSPFQTILWNTLVAEFVRVIDPSVAGGERLQEAVRFNPPLGDAVFCLSVLEHVEDLDEFLYHLGCLVAPGGLLFLTMDACDDYLDDWPADPYQFHWMRKRIFNGYGWRLGVAETLQHQSFSLLGEADWTYHGATVYDYTFCSLALHKRP